MLWVTTNASLSCSASPGSGAAVGGVALKSLEPLVSDSTSWIVEELLFFVGRDEENTRDKPNDAIHISHKQTNE